MGRQGLFGSRTNVTPALGLSWANLVTTRLMLSRTDSYVQGCHTSPLQCQNDDTSVQGTDGTDRAESSRCSGKAKRTTEYNIRTLEVVFCPWLERKSCSFVVTEKGIEDDS